jgi:hypothetical protein
VENVHSDGSSDSEKISLIGFIDEVTIHHVGNTNGMHSRQSSP